MLSWSTARSQDRKFVTRDSWRSRVSHFSIWYTIVSLSVLCYLLLYFSPRLFFQSTSLGRIEKKRERERERHRNKVWGVSTLARCSARFGVQKLLSPRHPIFAKTDFWVNFAGWVGICFLYCRIWYATPIFYYLLMHMYVYAWERARERLLRGAARFGDIRTNASVQRTRVVDPRIDGRWEFMSKRVAYARVYMHRRPDPRRDMYIRRIYVGVISTVRSPCSCARRFAHRSTLRWIDTIDTIVIENIIQRYFIRVMYEIIKLQFLKKSAEIGE